MTGRRRWGRVAAVALGVLAAATLALVASPDPVSGAARGAVERASEAHWRAMLGRAQRGRLGWWDRAQLHVVSIAGIAVGYVVWPEAARVARHCLYGDGSPLTLDASYFARSAHLRREVARLGPGDHGPIGMRQADDWRLSLAFNPYFLRITRDSVTLHFPDQRFLRPAEPVSHTVIPVGRLRLTVYDNLFGALQRHPFDVAATWARQDGDHR